MNHSSVSTLKSPCGHLQVVSVTPATPFFHPLVVAGPRRYRVSPTPPPSAVPLAWQDPIELHPRLNANVALGEPRAPQHPTTTTGKYRKYKNQTRSKLYFWSNITKNNTHQNWILTIQSGKMCSFKIGTLSNRVVGYSTWYICRALFCVLERGVPLLLRCCFSVLDFIYRATQKLC